MVSRAACARWPEDEPHARKIGIAWRCHSPWKAARNIHAHHAFCHVCLHLVRSAGNLFLPSARQELCRIESLCKTTCFHSHATSEVIRPRARHEPVRTATAVFFDDHHQGEEPSTGEMIYPRKGVGRMGEGKRREGMRKTPVGSAQGVAFCVLQQCHARMRARGGISVRARGKVRACCMERRQAGNRREG